MANIAEIIIKICTVITTVLSALYLFRGVFIIIGLFTTRRFSKTDAKHRYGILIAARNEEKMIPNLLSSIKKQDYPADLITTFVIAHNCTDGTADAARAGGAVCYEYNNPSERTKGFALKHLLERIKDDYGIDHYDAYIVFDADNLLESDYISHMNEAFDSGEKVVTSFRSSKNFHENWISFSYAVHWICTAMLESRARSILNLATRIQGTGFMFASEIVKDGWRYTSLTEDRAFAADLVVMGYPISYCEAARFYDEQPSSLKIALRQRIRWAKGHLQAFAESGGKLFLNIFRKNRFMSYDMFLITLPESLIYNFADVIVFAANIVLIAVAGASPASAFQALLGMLAADAMSYLAKIIIPIYVLIAAKDMIPKYKSKAELVLDCALFPLFSVIGSIAMLIALFTKVEWKPIPHTYVADIDSIKKEKELLHK